MLFFASSTRPSASEPPSGARERSRREIAALLEEIKAPRPSRGDVLRVVWEAADGVLDPAHATRIADRVLALSTRSSSAEAA